MNSAASATRDHVLNHQPWTYCFAVSDGTQTLLHIGCRCGHDTHVGEIVTWVPTPPAADGTTPCKRCGRGFTKAAVQQKYCSPACYEWVDARRRKLAKQAERVPA